MEGKNSDKTRREGEGKIGRKREGERGEDCIHFFQTGPIYLIYNVLTSYFQIYETGLFSFMNTLKFHVYCCIYDTYITCYDASTGSA